MLIFVFQWSLDKKQKIAMTAIDLHRKFSCEPILPLLIIFMLKLLHLHHILWIIYTSNTKDDLHKINPFDISSLRIEEKCILVDS